MLALELGAQGAVGLARPGRTRDLVSEASCPGMGWVSGEGAAQGSWRLRAGCSGKSQKSTLRGQGQTPKRSGANTGAPEAKEK